MTILGLNPEYEQRIEREPDGYLCGLKLESQMSRAEYKQLCRLTRLWKKALPPGKLLHDRICSEIQSRGYWPFVGFHLYHMNEPYPINNTSPRTWPVQEMKEYVQVNGYQNRYRWKMTFLATFDTLDYVHRVIYRFGREPEWQKALRGNEIESRMAVVRKADPIQLPLI